MTKAVKINQNIVEKMHAVDKRKCNCQELKTTPYAFRTKDHLQVNPLSFAPNKGYKNPHLTPQPLIHYQLTLLSLQLLNHDYIQQKAVQVLTTRTHTPWPPHGRFVLTQSFPKRLNSVTSSASCTWWWLSSQHMLAGFAANF